MTSAEFTDPKPSAEMYTYFRVMAAKLLEPRCQKHKFKNSGPDNGFFDDAEYRKELEFNFLGTMWRPRNRFELSIHTPASGNTKQIIANRYFKP